MGEGRKKSGRNLKNLESRNKLTEGRSRARKKKVFEKGRGDKEGVRKETTGTTVEIK